MARANTEVRMKELLGWGCTKRERKWPILGRDAAYSLPTPVSASLNCTCTSSATMEVSPHSPSPILNCRRLSGSVPVAVVVVPDWASCTGMLTFWTWPLMLSLPSTWYLPPPSALTAVESNTACGNLATLNQSALGSSASVSLAPMVALPVSTVKRILLVSGLAVSNWTWASNFLKWPCRGTPICLAVKFTALWAGTSFCSARSAWDARAAAARAMEVSVEEKRMARLLGVGKVRSGGGWGRMDTGPGWREVGERFRRGPAACGRSGRRGR